jgi:Fe-S-cluster-containing dehydrogenase component
MLLKKRIKNLFKVNYNKSAFSCNPCMDACKKVNRKINGRELSTVSNKEIKQLLKVFVSS